MAALTTFIKIYILSFIVFLIPSANNIQSSNGLENSPELTFIETNMVINLEANNAYAKSLNARYVSETNRNIKSQRNAANTIQPNIGEIAVNNTTNKNSKIDLITPDKIKKYNPDFWTTLHSIESKQGLLLYRPSNKNRNCKTTSAPCGHHQLTLNALKDISCSSKQCLDDREDYEKSLAMSKQLFAINDERLVKAGYKNLPDYQKYLIHQQGASGLKMIISASKGKKLLPKSIKKNMANNSPYSYKKLKKLGSTNAAKKFLKHWEEKWQDEKKLIIAKSLDDNTKLVSKDKVAKAVLERESTADRIFFNDLEQQIALNLKL